MFLSSLSQCSNFIRSLFCYNQPIFVYRMPIDFFYFEDFRWSFFGKITKQKIMDTFTHDAFIEG